MVDDMTYPLSHRWLSVAAGTGRCLLSGNHQEDFSSRQHACRHLLLCPEEMLSDNLIMMPQFIDNLQRCDFMYPGDQVVASVHTLMLLVQHHTTHPHT